MNSLQIPVEWARLIGHRLEGVAVEGISTPMLMQFVFDNGAVVRAPFVDCHVGQGRPTMKIERDVPTATIEAFAVKHDLTMVVCELGLRFCAYFKGIDILEDGMLVGKIGDGPTERDAIRDYARAISGREIVVAGPTRRVIRVPELKVL